MHTNTYCKIVPVKKAADVVLAQPAEDRGSHCHSGV